MASITLRRCDNCGLTIEAKETTESWLRIGVQSLKYREFGYSGYLEATSGEFCKDGCARAWLEGQAAQEMDVYVAAAAQAARKRGK